MTGKKERKLSSILAMDVVSYSSKMAEDDEGTLKLLEERRVIIEKNIKILSDKADKGSLSIGDLQGGTFTISNGGVYGSMLSTPIINPPQSGVLGMHNIVERAIVLNGEIKIRPVMYLALSYDHRIIDGKEAVSFLKEIKENLEEPEKLFLDN